ncbi:Pol polyprotein [Vitis vinifera]|uniref:Pol polyprotein n=1 Tax=Vitis vinifera TaxID=29760 RepID=A0A438C8M8_VITVI|nr:Pol polyprotein [Vitis vinifera]
MFVATDYFSKWVEAEAHASIKDKDVSKFVWKNIMCRFRVPQAIVADNGPQFDSIVFRTFCSELNIKKLYSTPYYPQSNGKAEATNKTLLTALKKMVERAKGKWVDELPRVLWLPGQRLDDQQEIGTLVLRRVFENTTEVGVVMLQANWEGPYVVTKSRPPPAKIKENKVTPAYQRDRLQQHLLRPRQGRLQLRPHHLKESWEYLGTQPPTLPSEWKTPLGAPIAPVSIAQPSPRPSSC